MKKATRILALVLCAVMCLGLFVGCGNKGKQNNDTPLVVGYSPFNSKFSPFFYTNDYENQVMSMVFDVLLGTDREGSVVLKGIEHGDGLIHNYVWGDAIDFTETTNAKLPYMLHGTGDVFASTLLAAVMAGSNLAEATAFAADFTADAMLISAKQPNFEDRGVSFEPLLGKVTALLG